MEYYLAITNTEGVTRIVPISDVADIPVAPGDDVVVMDGEGNPVDVSLRPNEEDLVLTFPDGEKATLLDFYETGPGDEPITISLNPALPVDDEYEFNSQTGNLPNGTGFSLMRFSNTEYIQFVEQIDELAVGSLLSALGSGPRAGGGGGGDSSSPFPDFDFPETEDLILDPVPDAVPDFGSGLEDGAPITLNLLANDGDERGGGLVIHAVGGQVVDVGSRVTLSSGTVVTVGAGGVVTVEPGGEFDSLQEGESTTESFLYTIRDAGGNLDTSNATVTILGVNDPPEANPDLYNLNEDAPVTVEVLENDTDPEGDTLTVTGISTPSAGIATLNPDNSVTYDPNGEFESLGVGETATVTIDYTIADDRGETATSTATFVIEGVNDAPDAMDDSVLVSEDSPITIDVLANDVDPDTNDSLTITGVTQPGPNSGSVAYNADDLTFNPSSDFEYLNVGETATVTFTYDISDGNGGTDTATVTVTVDGVDDATVINPDSAITNEGSAVQVDVLANDRDVDDTLSVASVTQPTDTNDGTVVNNGGDVTFTPGSNFNSLAVGESATTTFTYTTNTGATETVTVTINGTNDAPVAVNDTDAVNEDATIVVNAANGVIQGPGTDTDADVSDTLTVIAVENSSSIGALVGNPLVGVYGTLTLNEDGSYSYAADQDAADPLAVGETVNDVFTYTVSDGNGGTDTATLTITVTGTNDVPIANPPGGTPGVDPGVYDDADTIAEDDALPASGNVLDNDVDLDATDVLVVSEVNGVAGNVANAVTGTFGEITIDADGSYDYFLNNGNATVQGLAVGETLTETFTYTADDQNGGTATATLTITITGTNDIPIANPPGGTPGVVPGVYDDSDTISEDSFPNTTDGNVLSNDLDPDGDTLTVAAVDGVGTNVGSQIAGTYGAVTINSDGGYSYVLNNGNPAVNALDDGETLTDTFTYTADDGNGGTATATLTITINGTDDATVINPDAATTDEDTAVTVDVLANDSDVDDTLSVASVTQPTDTNDGTVVNNGGDVTFTPGSNFNTLAVGESATTTFTYTTNTGSTETVTVTVHGANDAPVAVDDAGTTDQDSAVTIDLLGADDSVAADSDPDGDSLTILSINGVAAGGTITLPSGALVTVNSDGTVSYDPNGQFGTLDLDESVVDSFAYTISDGNGGTATATAAVTINGIDDALDADPDFASTSENQTIMVDVLANDSDPDTTDNPLAIGSFDTTTSGGGTVSQIGEQLEFNPGSDFDDLAVGETEIVTFDYTVENADGATATETVTITVTGTNDGPVAVNDTDAVDEDATIVVNAANGVIQGPGTDTDADVSDTLTVIAVENSSSIGALVGNPLVGVYGTLTLNEDGSYSYAADQDAADPLAVGETVNDVFTYTVSDGNGGTDTATLTITVTGTNDVPIANPPGGTPGVEPGVYDDADTIAEDDALPASGNVLDNDVDLDATDVLVVSEVNGVAGNVANAVTGTFGEITIDADGSYDYFLNNGNATVQGLAVGETLTETFTYTADDQNGGTATATLTITITGTNDVPALNPGVGPGVYDDTDSISEDAFPNITDGNVLANDTDPDGDTLTVAQVNGSATNVGSQIVGTYGAVTIDSDGGYRYVLNNANPAINALDDGETLTDTFTYTADDGNGGTATATLTIAINGSDDPTVIDPDSATTDENSPVTISVLANDSDPDDALSVAELNGATLWPVAVVGGGTATSDGTTVTFDPGGDFDGLSRGESATVTFSYTTNTGATETVTVTVNGRNDAPNADDDTGATDQNSTVAIDVLANDNDPDANDILQISGVNQPSSGSVGVNASNQLVFDPGDDFDYLSGGETAVVTFDYTISDGNGGSDTATVSVTVTGTDDATVVTPDNAVTDEKSFVDIDVLANDSDPDANENPLTVDSVDPTGLAGGTVTIALDGSSVRFDPDGDFDSLGMGESAVTSFTYTTNTGATETVNVTINGANDAPIAVDDADSTDEKSVVNIDLIGPGDSIAADSDPDGDFLTLWSIDGNLVAPGSVVTLASGALVTVNADGTVDYDPNGQFDSLDAGETLVETFTYTISDGNGGTDTATASVTIGGVDDAIETDPDTASVSENGTVDIDVLANDSDPDTTDNPLTVLSVTQPSRGLVTNNGGNVTFDPSNGFENLATGETATVSFTYTVENQDGATATETVTVTVTGENDGPTTHEDTLHTMEGVGRVIDVIQNDSDVDNAQLSITQINGVNVTANQQVALSSGATVTVMEDGRVYYNPNGAYNPLGFGETGAETFSYTVTDADGATAVETVSVVVDGVDNPVLVSGAYQVLSNQLYEIQLDPADESIRYVPIGDPLPYNFNSLAFNANDNLLYANSQGDDAGSGVTNGDVIQINLFTGQVVGNLGQFTNDQGEGVPSYAGVINAGIGPSGTYYVNGPSDSAGNTAYAIDLATGTVTAIGQLPGADFGVDINTGLLWSVNNGNSYSLDPTSGALTTFTHGGLQDDGMSGATGTFGSMFSDGDGNIQVTSNSGYGLYRLDPSDGSLTRIGDAPATSSNDATGTLNTALPSAQPFVVLDEDGSTGASGANDAIRNYDPNGAPVSIADSDIAIADLDGDTMVSARIVLTNTFPGDMLAVNGTLPAGIVASVGMEGGFLVLTLSGSGSQGDYEQALGTISFSNSSGGSMPTDPRQIAVTVTDIDGVTSNTVNSFVFIGAGTGVISGRDVETAPGAIEDSMVLSEDDNDLTDGGARFNLLQNDSDNPTSITSISQPPSGNGAVTDNGDGTVTFHPGDDFQYLSEGETAITTFFYTTDTGQTETVTVTVHGVDDPLVANPDSAVTDASALVAINVLANDEDPDASDNPLLLTAVTQPSSGSVTIVGNQAVFNPGTDFDTLAIGETAVVTFNYTVTNADGIDQNEAVTVTVNGSANNPPDAVNDMASTAENSPVTIDVLANDLDNDPGDSFSIVNFTQPVGGGTVTSAGSELRFDPGTSFDYLDAGQVATVTFQYSIQDLNGATDTATVTVTVNGAEDPTITAPDSATINPVTTTHISGEETTSNTMRAGSVDIVVTDSGHVSDGSDATFNNIAAWSNPAVQGAPSYELVYDGSGNGTVTFTFSQAVTNPILHIDRLGGTSGSGDNTSRWSIANSGATVSKLSGSADFFVSSGGTYFQQTLENPRDSDTESSMDLNSGTAAGSIRVNGTFTSITFNLTMQGGAGVGDEVELAWEVTHHDYNPTSVNVIANDSDIDANDNPLTVVGLSSPTRGSVSTDGTNVTFDPGTDFEFLNAGQSVQQVVTYTLNTGATGQVTFTVNGASTPHVPPIVIDLDGDGVEFDSIEEGILFDVDGDGDLEQIAWADEDDAVLIYDQNDNNDVDGLDEFAFSRYSDDPNATDLEGLRHFDTNNDLVLDANDDEFESFKLWQDRDGDGIVDEGEMMTLREAGIDSLELTSDGISYDAADGDVFVHGEAGVNYADGTRGALADAEFDYEELATEDHPIEVITDDGEVLNLSESDVEVGEATPELVEPAPDPIVCDMPVPEDEGGAISPTTVEEDVAAADSAMS